MKAEDFEILVESCKFFLDDEKVRFVPYSIKDNKRVAKILIENKMTSISLDEFNEIAKQSAPLYQARKKLKQQQLGKYNAMSADEIAKQPMENKVEYLELLFPRNQTKEDVDEVCRKNEENIRACLFHLDFPQSFWQKEKEQAARYASLVANSPEITQKLKNWQDTSLDDKKEVIKQSLKIFEYVYGDAPKLEFYTEAQERERLVKLGYPEDVHVNAANYHEGVISFNTDRLQESDNLFAVSVPFHEGTHYRQDVQSFGDALVDRIFQSSVTNLLAYDNERNDKQDKNYKDLYTMLPCEVHAYGLQEYMENELIQNTGIQKANDKDTPVVKRIHNKGYSMAKVNQYRSR